MGVGQFYVGESGSIISWRQQKASPPETLARALARAATVAASTWRETGRRRAPYEVASHQRHQAHRH